MRAQSLDLNNKAPLHIEAALSLSKNYSIRMDNRAAGEHEGARPAS